MLTCVMCFLLPAVCHWQMALKTNEPAQVSLAVAWVSACRAKSSKQACTCICCSASFCNGPSCISLDISRRQDLRRNRLNTSTDCQTIFKCHASSGERKLCTRVQPRSGPHFQTCQPSGGQSGLVGPALRPQRFVLQAFATVTPRNLHHTIVK